MISRSAFPKKKALPRAKKEWVLDSGAFSEISRHGRWTVSAHEYADEIRRFYEEVGLLCWAAPQDWMCEPQILTRTGLTVSQHQYKTVVNLLELRSMSLPVPIIPVLQGWTLEDYKRHVDLYYQSGVDLRTEEVVGLGSVCRRQHTREVIDIIYWLASIGLSLHGFGLKITALKKIASQIVSADSMAWSYAARRNKPLPECSGHKNCANCSRWAYRWYSRVKEIYIAQKRVG